ncbi:hypothetical protein [Fundidesulfovibrio agrisoli]|uniref:hypothetical protein n=1 Tax=Fundidesulfovibrio agrisoli TaxID=2922717 RepID=UPI001FAC55E3|nr:hypothetical protein [Fundidesulfovibrio agrisoli]
MNVSHRAFAALSALAVAAALILGGAGASQAYERNTTVTGSGGKAVTKRVTGSKTADGYTRSATTTGPNGKSVEKDSSGSWDSSTKTWTKDKSVTGPGGQTKSWRKQTTVTQ